jgi:hypothetical protein
MGVTFRPRRECHSTSRAGQHCSCHSLWLPCKSSLTYKVTRPHHPTTAPLPRLSVIILMNVIKMEQTPAIAPTRMLLQTAR